MEGAGGGGGGVSASSSSEMMMMIKLKNGDSGGGVKCCCSPMCCGGSGGGGGGAIVRVVCNNTDCSYPQWMHAKCFDVWEQTVLQYVTRTTAAASGRGGGMTAAAAADRQRHHHQNLWTKKGYELAYKACGCLCGKGHLRKDMTTSASSSSTSSPLKGNGGRRGGGRNNNNNNKGAAAAIQQQQSNGGGGKSSSPPGAIGKQQQQQQPSAAVMMMNHQHQQMLLRNRANSLSSTGSTASCASSSSSASTSSSGSSSPPIAPTTAVTAVPSSSSLLLMGNGGGGGSAPTTSLYHHQQQQHPGVIGTQRRNRTATICNPMGLASSSTVSHSQSSSSSSSQTLSSGNSGLFLHRPDFSAFNALPRHKLNSFHIKMEDEGSYGNDDIRCFILSNLAMAKMSRTLCVVCTEPMAIYDRYPLVDGTFFLSPKQYSKACIPVTVEGRQQHLSAVCMSCLEGWTCWLRCRSCRTPWNGSHLILGTMYSYDVFAAVPCCPDRLRCGDCHGLVVQPDHRFQFFSQYSRDVTCPQCSSHGHHFVKPLPTIYQLYRHPLNGGSGGSCGSSTSSSSSSSSSSAAATAAITAALTAMSTH